MQGPNGGDDDDDGDDDYDDWYLHLVVGCICDAEKGTFTNMACVGYRQQKSAKKIQRKSKDFHSFILPFSILSGEFWFHLSSDEGILDLIPSAKLNGFKILI